MTKNKLFLTLLERILVGRTDSIVVDQMIHDEGLVDVIEEHYEMLPGNKACWWTALRKVRKEMAELLRDLKDSIPD